MTDGPARSPEDQSPLKTAERLVWVLTGQDANSTRDRERYERSLSVANAELEHVTTENIPSEAERLVFVLTGKGRPDISAPQALLDEYTRSLANTTQILEEINLQKK